MTTGVGDGAVGDGAVVVVVVLVVVVVGTIVVVVVVVAGAFPRVGKTSVGVIVVVVVPGASARPGNWIGRNGSRNFAFGFVVTVSKVFWAV